MSKCTCSGGCSYHALKAREYRIRNPEKVKESSRRWRVNNKELHRQRNIDYYYANREQILTKNKETSRERLLKRQYGLNLAEHDALSQKQGSGCAICGVPKNTRKLGAALPVDHDHVTRTVRGILCDDCNLLIGYAKDDISRLENAIAYLRGV